MQLENIPKHLHSSVIGAYWTMLGLLEVQANNENNALMKYDVEAFYRLWNKMTGDDKKAVWNKDIL